MTTARADADARAVADAHDPGRAGGRVGNDGRTDGECVVGVRWFVQGAAVGCVRPGGYCGGRLLRGCSCYRRLLPLLLPPPPPLLLLLPVLPVLPVLPLPLPVVVLPVRCCRCWCCRCRWWSTAAKPASVSKMLGLKWRALGAEG